MRLTCAVHIESANEQLCHTPVVLCLLARRSRKKERVVVVVGRPARTPSASFSSFRPTLAVMLAFMFCLTLAPRSHPHVATRRVPAVMSALRLAGGSTEHDPDEPTTFSIIGPGLYNGCQCACTPPLTLPVPAPACE